MIALRPALPDDALDILAWRNDPHTRAMSHDTRPVEEAAHLAWFARALTDDRRLILIAEAESGGKLGMVRFDRDGERWVASINVAPERRGSGHGAAMLDRGVERLIATRAPALITAEIRPDNIASRRIFEKCGFVFQREEGGFRHYTLAPNAAGAARSRAVTIAGRAIGPGHPPYVIAELSGNHNGDIGRALALIDAAADAGADAVKLQTYTADTITLDHDGPGFVLEGGLWHGRRLYDLYREAHTPWDWHERLFAHARDHGITAFSSPFDPTAVALLRGLDAPAYKIASFELIDLPLIAEVARAGKPIIMSTGLASPLEIAEAVAAARAGGVDDIILLHCTSGYPSPPAEMNLRTLQDLAAAHGTICGLSDHSMGTAVAVAAVALGAAIVEKHVTLRRADGGPDAEFSLEPEELRRLVADCRTAWEALGSVRYEEVPSEQTNRHVRRSLYIVADMRAGEVFTQENLRSIRPGFGMAPKHLPEILGRRAARDLRRGTPLDASMVEGE